MDDPKLRTLIEDLSTVERFHCCGTQPACLTLSGSDKNCLAILCIQAQC